MDQPPPPPESDTNEDETDVNPVDTDDGVVDDNEGDIVEDIERNYISAYTYFRFLRKDLHNTLKGFADGGTPYTFYFEIK